jgi:hypothetical protein
MNKTILEFILKGIVDYTNDQSLGEEIRSLKETIFNIIKVENNLILEVIYELINDYPNDQQLGAQIRYISHLILLSLYVEEDISGDCNTE